MECVLADEVETWGGEWSESEWRMLSSLFGDGDPDSADGLTFDTDVISEPNGDMPIESAD